MWALANRAEYFKYSGPGCAKYLWHRNKEVFKNSFIKTADKDSESDSELING